MRIVKVLKFFGLSDYEAKALATLIAKGVLSAKEVAELSGIPRTSVYDVMNSLKAKGFVEEFGRPVKFRAISNEEIISMISKRTAENIEILRDEMSKLRTEEIELIKLYRGKTVLEKLEELVLSSKTEIIALLSFIKPEIRKILSKAKCKLIVISENPEGLNAEAYKLEYGGKKISKDVSHGLLIFDGKKFFALFIDHVSIGIAGESEGIVEFSKLMIEPLLRELRVKKNF